MNTEFYRNFIAMVEAGGMNRAAREIHVAQPALTRQLQVLEKEYGAVLVKPRKGRHTLELTEAGWILYRQARQICEADRTAHAEISALEKGLTGTLRLSLTPSLMPMVIEKGILPFHKKYRDVTFRFRESYQVPLAEEVRRGISEAGITNAPLPDPFLFQVLHEETSSLAAAALKGSPFFPQKEALSARDLSSVPLAVSRSTEDQVSQFFRNEGLRPSPGRRRPGRRHRHVGSLGYAAGHHDPPTPGRPGLQTDHHLLLPEGPPPVPGHGTISGLSGKGTEVTRLRREG